MKMICTALIGAAWIVGSQAFAGTVSQNFDTPGTAFVGQKLPNPAFGILPQDAGPAPTVLAGDANSDGMFLQLKDTTRRVYTNAGFDAAGTENFDRIQGQFDFRMTCLGNRTGFGNGGCADGFTFGFLDTSKFGSSGQADSLTEGLVAFDEFSRVVDYDQPPVASIRSGLMVGLNIFQPSGLREGAFYVGTGLQADGLFIEDQNVDMVTGQQNQPDRFMTMMFDMNFGTDLLSLAVVDGATTHNIFDDLDISSFGLDAFNSRLALGARSGDAGASVDIDNINITFTPAAAVSTVPLPGALGLLLSGLCAVAGTRKLRTSKPALG